MESFLFYITIIHFGIQNGVAHWRFYDEQQQGLDGRDEHIKNHQIAEVEFKPNRLLMFDGKGRKK